MLFVDVERWCAPEDCGYMKHGDGRACYGMHGRNYLLMLTWRWCANCWCIQIIPHSRRSEYKNLDKNSRIYFNVHQRKVDRLLEAAHGGSVRGSAHDGFAAMVAHGYHHMAYVLRREKMQWGWAEENINTQLAGKDAVLRDEWALFCYQLQEMRGYLVSRTADKSGLEEVFQFASEFSSHRIA